MSVINVADVYKKYRRYHDKGQTLKERLLFRKRNAYEEHWVLKGISFALDKGEAVGIVGENGSGKSTILKLMSRIIVPDKGTLTVKGRVSSLIELGAGFHPDMSGRENIYINAAIFGLTKREIDDRLQDIIDFSELHAYIDSPVRTYSSGMYMRLAFSVAIHVNADVLLIDEILAVGDAAFQQKCFARLQKIKRNGTTIVIVSHSLWQIEQICERSLWLLDGEIVAVGKPADVHAQYMAYMAQKSGAPDTALRPDIGHIGEVALVGGRGGATAINAGEDAQIRVMLCMNGETPIIVEVSVQSIQGLLMTKKDALAPGGAKEAVLHLHALPLVQGDYCVNVNIYTKDHMLIDMRDRAAILSVTSSEQDSGAVHVPSGWEFLS